MYEAVRLRRRSLLIRVRAKVPIGEEERSDDHPSEESECEEHGSKFDPHAFVGRVEPFGDVPIVVLRILCPVRENHGQCRQQIRSVETR